MTSAPGDIATVFVRHGRDTRPAKPAGWATVPLSPVGRDDAEAAGLWILEHGDQLPRLTHIVSSPLPRALETAGILQRVTGITDVRVDNGLKAFDGSRETAAAFRRRSAHSLTQQQLDSGALAVGHRSFSSFVAQRYGVAVGSDPQYINGLTEEGGAFGISRTSLTPLYREIPENWLGLSGRAYDYGDEDFAPSELPEDEEPVDEAPSDDDEHQDDENRRRAVRALTSGGFEHRGALRDRTPLHLQNFDESWRAVRRV